MVKEMAKKKEEKVVLEKKDEKENNKDITKTLILALVGLVLVLIPNTLNKLIGIIVGIVLIALGAIAIYKYVKKENTGGIDLAVGILYAVLGIIVMVYPHSVVKLVAICLGVYLLIAGLMKVKTSIDLKDTNSKWIGTLIIGLLILVLGLLLIFDPFAGVTITKLAGVFLLVFAVIDIIDIYIIQK